MISKLIAVIVCVILSAYFSATETAFSSVNKTRLKVLADNGNRKARLAFDLAENYDKLISTILIGNNVVNIAMASIGTLLFVELLGSSGATVSTAVITIVVLIFGEITPKSVAKDHPETFAMFAAPSIRCLIWLLTPVNFLFSQWKKLVGKLFRSSGESKMSQAELLMLLEEVQHEGAIDAEESELLKNAVEFGDLQAQDILTHRLDLAAVPLTATGEEVAQLFTETRFSRILVYEQTIDKIVGVIHQKDFYVGSGIVSAPLSQIMTPAVFVPPTEKIDDLLQVLRSAKSHIAVVVDEYGGTLGIVTMEDILEELVGEIWDEHDEVEEPFRRTGECTYLVDGAVCLSDFCDYFDVRSQSSAISLGGWSMEPLGRIPEQGARFDYETVTVTVATTAGNRVETVDVCTKAPITM